MDSNFTETVKACQNNCFGDCRMPSWFNTVKIVYDKKQSELKESWKSLTNIEKDTVVRNKIYAELRKHAATSLNDRICLEYTESFGDKKIQLCENCFVFLYNHKGKRTYESWKAEMKKSIAFDATAADVQHSLPKRRRQTNW